jgi:hypothetical protein
MSTETASEETWDGSTAIGTWDVESTAENYEDYLKEIGVIYVARKAAMKIKPRMISNKNCL